MADIYEELNKSPEALLKLKGTVADPNPSTKPYLDKCGAGGGKVAIYRRDDGSLIYVVGKGAFDNSNAGFLSSENVESSLYIFFEKNGGRPVVCFPMGGNDQVYYNQEKYVTIIVKKSDRKALGLDNPSFKVNGFSSNLTYDWLQNELAKLEADGDGFVLL